MIPHSVSRHLVGPSLLRALRQLGVTIAFHHLYSCCAASATTASSRIVDSDTCVSIASLSVEPCSPNSTASSLAPSHGSDVVVGSSQSASSPERNTHLPERSHLSRPSKSPHISLVL